MQQTNRIAMGFAGHSKESAAGSSSLFARGSEAQQKALAVAILGAIVLLSVAGQAQHTRRERASLMPGQVITSIRKAVSLTPGRVLMAQAALREGHFYCDVQILSPDGRTHKVAVDTAPSKATLWAGGTLERETRRHESLLASEAAAIAWPSS